MGIFPEQDGSASMTGGLVAQQNFSVLPNVPAIVTGVVTLLFMLVRILFCYHCRLYCIKIVIS